jgi:NAD(P)-dependent dehydrogenase (short-subunit alcohol dehydrogenase family)
LTTEPLNLVADVSNRAQVMGVIPEALQRFGRVDVLVNAAGILLRESMLSHRPESWATTLGVNLDGPFWLSQAFVREKLRSATGGSIVNVCSAEALYPRPGHIAYSTSKGALLMLTRAMALELAPHGIRVNAVGPGVIETPMNADVRSDDAASSELRERIPLGRFGKPAEVADVIEFLASERAAYVTGAFLLIDGGWTVH